MGDPLKLHIHTDCSTFAGCENMVAVLLSSERLVSSANLSLSYRHSRAYEAGLTARVPSSVGYRSFPQMLPDPDSWSNTIPRGLSVILKVAALICRGPVFLYHVAVLWFLFVKTKPDVLHVNNGGYPGALSARAAILAGALAGVRRRLMVVNNLAVNYRRPARWLDWPVDMVVKRLTHLFVTGSTSASERLAFVLGENTFRRVQHNATVGKRRCENVDQTRERLGFEDRHVLLGTVALLVPRKGHRILVEAVELLRDQNAPGFTSARFVIEGTGPLDQQLRQMVIDRGLTDWVHFVGSEDHIADFMAAMDVMLLPSIANEDFPNVVTEAFLHAKPVIASRLAGTPEQIDHGETGLLVPPGDAAALAGSIQALLMDPERVVQMGHQAAIVYNAKFKPDVVASQYLNIYQNLLNQ